MTNEGFVMTTSTIKHISLKMLPLIISQGTDFRINKNVFFWYAIFKTQGGLNGFFRAYLPYPYRELSWLRT